MPKYFQQDTRRESYGEASKWDLEQNFEKSLTSRIVFNPERQIALESERHEDGRIEF